MAGPAHIRQAGISTLPTGYRACFLLTSLALSSGCSTCSRKPDIDSSASGSTATSTDSMTGGPSTTEVTTGGPSTTEVTTSSATESGSSGPMTTGGVCGDGMLDPGEDCDDGNQTPADGCENDCAVTPSVCGDEKIDPDEACDDGNGNNTDACVKCLLASCGDGYVRAGVEKCDDGANNGMYDFCAKDCSGPGLRCGDGEVNGPEECDDGNQVDEDNCSNDCVAPRYVFVTANKFTGNLGGLAGADEKCDISGDTIKSKATWVAWLSDDTTSASMRLDNKFTGYYRLPGMGEPVIAKGWTGLTSGPLLVPINRTQTGAAVADQLAAWTDTAQDGSKLPGTENCNNWSSNSFQMNGRAGALGPTDKSWTDAVTSHCGTSLRLYCFQN